MATPAAQTPSDEHGPRPPRPSAGERQELNHRLANSLQLAADFLVFEHARASEPQARDALLQAAGRIAAVAHLHRFLCAHDETAEVDLEPFFADLCGLIGQSTGLECRSASDPIMVAGAIAQQLGLAVNELAINAAKHAYRPGEAGELLIECRADAGFLHLSVSDRGGGVGEGFDPARPAGLGMAILRAIARQLRGTLTARDDHGARFTLTLPAPSPGAPEGRSFAPADGSD